MAAITPEELARELERQAERFREQLDIRYSSIDAAWKGLRRAWSVEQLDELYRIAHTLAGSAGTFGYLRVGEASRELEGALRQLLESGQAPGEAELAQVELLVAAIGEQVVRAERSQIGMLDGTGKGKEPHSNREVYIVEDDEGLAETIAAEIGRQGYRSRHFASLHAFEEAFEQGEDGKMPSAIIIDMIFPEGESAGAEAVSRLRDRFAVESELLPIIMISGRSDIEARLTALRAGATRYLHKPLNFKRLIYLLDELTQRSLDELCTVLLVEDDPAQSTYYASLLATAGMKVIEINDPLEALQRLPELEFHVIVSDIHMPGCSGYELAAIVREDDAFNDIPIIFLSSEEDISRQLLSLNLGGDDFLVKPIDVNVFVSKVRARARRSRHMSQVTWGLRHALRENEYQRLALDQHAIVSIADAAGNITYCNNKFCEVSGYSRSELIGHNHRIIKSEVHPPEFFQTMWRTITSGEVWHGEVCNRTKDGHYYWVESTVVPFLDERGRPYQYISVRTDITEVKRLEEQASTMAERLARSQSFANIGTWDWNIETGDLFWSERIAPLFGYKVGELETTYENFLNAVHPDDRDAVVAAVGACVEGTAEYNIEHRVVWPDGKVRWVLEQGDVVRDADGKPQHMLGVVSDINVRKMAEAALQQSEERFTFAIEGAGDGVWDWNMVTGEMPLSGFYEEMLGFRKGELEPTIEAWVKSVHPDDLGRVQKDLQSYLEGESPSYTVELRLRCKDDSYKWVLCRGTVVALDDDYKPTRMIGVHSDITERKAMEQHLSDQKQLLDMLNKSMSGFVATADFSVTMNEMLDTLLELTGSEYGFTGEVLYDGQGSPYLKTHAITNIAWSPESQALYDEFADKGFEFRNLNTLFGHVLCSHDIVVSNDPANDPRAGGLPPGHPPMDAFLGVPIFYGDELVGMYGVANRKGGYDNDLLALLQPFDTTYGVLIHSKRMIETEEHNRKELIRARDEAESANRAKSTFLSSMSHELRTPMNAILGFSQLLEIDDALSEENRDNVAEIIKAGNHLLELINEVLDLAKIESGRIDLSIEPVEYGPVLTECLSLISPLAQQRSITIEMGDEACGEVVVRGDRIRLKQVVLNLLSNAVKYNREAGRIVIVIEPAAEGRVRLVISDTGEGIPPELQRELFQPFNRLGAEAGGIEGTGIGLVISKQLIEMMGGAIGVESRPGEGSRFWIELPLDEVQGMLPGDGGDAGQAPELAETLRQYTVIYVEDNPANIRLVSQLLAQRNHIRLLTAHRPGLGLELIEAHDPDLVLLDINMPEMDGYEVLRILRENPKTARVPVVAVTANAMPKDIERGRAAGFLDYVTKPIDVKAFLATIEAALQ